MSLEYFDNRFITLANFLFCIARQTGHQTKDWDLFVSMMSCLHLLWPPLFSKSSELLFCSSSLVPSSEMGCNGARTWSLSSGWGISSWSKDEHFFVEWERLVFIYVDMTFEFSSIWNNLLYLLLTMILVFGNVNGVNGALKIIVSVFDACNFINHCFLFVNFNNFMILSLWFL